NLESMFKKKPRNKRKTNEKKRKKKFTKTNKQKNPPSSPSFSPSPSLFKLFFLNEIHLPTTTSILFTTPSRVCSLSLSLFFFLFLLSFYTSFFHAKLSLHTLSHWLSFAFLNFFFDFLRQCTTQQHFSLPFFPHS